MRLWGLVLLCVITAAASADQLYKWVDEQGKVHYSQTPPPGAGSKAKAVEVHVSPADPAKVQAAQDEARQRQAEQEEAAQYAAMTPDQKQAVKPQRCKELQARLSSYVHSDAARTPDRQKAMDDLEAQIAKDCD